MTAAQQTNVWGEEINDWGPGNQWVGPRKSMVRTQETNGCSPGDQWEVHRKPMLGVPREARVSR